MPHSPCYRSMENILESLHDTCENLHVESLLSSMKTSHFWRPLEKVYIAKGVTWGGGGDSGCQLNFHLTVFLFISGEFGIVYKGKVSCTGRPARKVAVKTLKGWFFKFSCLQLQ